MVDQPGIFVKANHGHVPEDIAFLLVDKMPGNAGALGVELFIDVLDAIFVGFDIRVFIRINEPGFKKEPPERIQVDLVANVRIAVVGLVQKGQELDVVLRVHVDNRQSTFDPDTLFPLFADSAVDDLGLAVDRNIVGKPHLHFRDGQTGQELGV